MAKMSARDIGIALEEPKDDIEELDEWQAELERENWENYQNPKPTYEESMTEWEYIDLCNDRFMYECMEYENDRMPNYDDDWY